MMPDFAPLTPFPENENNTEKAKLELDYKEEVIKVKKEYVAKTYAKKNFIYKFLKKLLAKEEYEHRIVLGKTYQNQSDKEILRCGFLKSQIYKIIWDGKGEEIVDIEFPIRFRITTEEVKGIQTKCIRTNILTFIK